MGTLEQDTEFQNAHITFTHMQLELAPVPSPCSQTGYSSYKLENTATLLDYTQFTSRRRTEHKFLLRVNMKFLTVLNSV